MSVDTSAPGIMKGYEGVLLTPQKLNIKRLFFHFSMTKYFQTGKIIKMVATRCNILKLICIKFDFSWGSAPDPAGGA